MIYIPVGAQKKSIEGQAFVYAYMVEYTETKTLRFFPRTKGWSSSNEFRLETLRKLFRRNYYTVQKGRELDAFEQYAREQGYTFADVDPAEYTPKLYKAEIQAQKNLLQMA